MLNYYFILKDKYCNVKKINLPIQSLESLDKYSLQFANEMELKDDLYKSQIISFEDLDMDISIAYQYRNELKNLDIIYKSFMPYMNKEEIRYFVLGNFEDCQFLEKILKKCYHKVPFELIRHLEERKLGKDNHYEYPYMQELFVNYLFHTIKRNGYRFKRDIASIIYKQELKKNKKVLTKKKTVEEKKTVKQDTLFPDYE